MERGTKTTANHLKIGDRFYKVKDKAKKPLEMVDSEPVTTQYRTYRKFCVEAAIMDATLIPMVKKLNQKTAILSNTDVVFLRSALSANEPINENIVQIADK